VNFCDDTDATIIAAKAFAISGSSDTNGQPILANLTADMIQNRDPALQPRFANTGSMRLLGHGCDLSQGGLAPDYIEVSIPDGYPITPNIPYVAPQQILFKADSSSALRRDIMRRRSKQSGQATVEYAITFAAIMAPLMFAIIFTAELLWVWHSIVDFTRDGASYAATHCFEAGGRKRAGLHAKPRPTDGRHRSIPRRPWQRSS